MRKYLLCILSLSACFTATARQPYKADVTKMQRPGYGITQAILQKQFINKQSVNKTTGLQKRLIANSYVTQGSLQDSNHYYYSFGRGSMLSDANSYYDSYFPTTYDDKKTLLCDKSANWHDFGTGLEYRYQYEYKYNAANKVIDMLYTSDFSQSEYNLTYNSSNKRETLVMIDSFNGTPFEPKSTRYFSYDAQGRLVTDSTVDISNNLTTGRNEYTYNASGFLVLTNSYYFDDMTGAMVNYYRLINKYDNQNRLVSALTQYDFLGSGMQNNSLDSYAYAGTSAKYVYYTDSWWSGQNNNWQLSSMQTYHYNAQELVDTYYIHEWNGIQVDTVERDVYIYDNNNLMLHSHGYLYMGNGIYSTTPYDTSSMYYEDYDPTAVSNVKNISKEIVLYPSPATKMLTINGGNITGDVSVLNTIGQIMMTCKNLSLQNGQVDISGLPAGNYMISIRAKDGSIAQKQFTKI